MRKGFHRIRPEPRDDIAIVHGVLWLDAGGQPELRESGNIRRLQHLGVLDGTVGVCARRRVEHDGVRLIADGWHAMANLWHVAPWKYASIWSGA